MVWKPELAAGWPGPAYVPTRPLFRSPFLWHYTSVSALRSICDSRTFWASRIDALNDPGEMRYGFNILVRVWNAAKNSELRKAIPATLYKSMDERFSAHAGDDFDVSSLIGDVCILSASSHGDSLNQWRNYADGGVAMGLRHGVPLAMGGEWSRVLYGRKNHEQHGLRVLLDEMATESGCAYRDEWIAPSDNMIAGLGLLKHPAYRDEHEYRLIFRHSGDTALPLRERVINERVIRYVTVPWAQPVLGRVMCGPSDTEARAATKISETEELLMESGLWRPDYPARLHVTASAIPYVSHE